MSRGRALSLVVKCSTRTQDMQTTWLSKVLRGQEKHKSHKARCSPCNINHPNGVLFFLELKTQQAVSKFREHHQKQSREGGNTNQLSDML